ARHERDLCFRDDASSTRDSLPRSERSRRATEQNLRSIEIAELRHRNSAKRERRRVFTQRYSIECAKRIAGGQRPSRGRDQRVHRNPDTVVTPIVRCAYRNLSHVNEAHPTGEKKHDHSYHRNEKRMARSTCRAAAGGEGAHEAQRRAGATPPGAAVGSRREGLQVRNG